MSKTNKQNHAKPEPDLANIVLPGDELLLTWPDASSERVKVLETHGAADLHKPTRVIVERIDHDDHGSPDFEPHEVYPTVPLAWLTPIPY